MTKLMITTLVSIFLAGCVLQIKELNRSRPNEGSQFTQKTVDRWLDNFPAYHLTLMKMDTEDKLATTRGLMLNHPDSKDLIFIVADDRMNLVKNGLPILKAIASLNTDIVMFDPRGHGTSSGKPTIADWVKDTKTQITRIRQELNPDSITLYGFIFGSTIAAYVAKTTPIEGLVLQHAFTTVNDALSQVPSWKRALIYSVEVDDVFKSIDNAKILAEHYNAPLLIIGHQTPEDPTIKMSQTLFDVSQSPLKRLVGIEVKQSIDALHSPKLIQAFKRFIKQNRALRQ